VTRRSTWTESLSQSPNTFGDSKLARQPDMCRGQSNTTGVYYSVRTEFILLSVRALDAFVYSARDMQQYGKVVRLERACALWKEQSEAFPTVRPSGQTNKLKALKARVKAENGPKWAQPTGSQ
jgi:hypothetical protein